MGSSLSTSQSNDAAELLPPCMEGDLDKVKELVGSFLATYSVTDRTGKTDEQKDEKLQAFIDSAEPQGGNNALHGAVYGGHLDVVTYLVESCHASLEIPNKLGCEPLWLAAGYNRISVLEYLLTKLSKPKESLLKTNKTGDTPLLAAASRANKKAIFVLVEIAKALGVVTELVNTSNRSKDTPLSVAIGAAVLPSPPNSTTTSSSSHSPFGSPAGRKGNSGSIYSILLEYSTKETINSRNQKGLTPLLIACERDNVKVVNMLLREGASISVCDDTGASALSVAAYCGAIHVIQDVLLRHGHYKDELLNKPNVNGCTPLWLAAKAGRPDVVELLLRAGADRTIANTKDGLTPLEIAQKSNRDDIAELFDQIQRNPEGESTAPGDEHDEEFSSADLQS